jgi:ABC-2 type transport system ATP-binding protein
MAAMIVVKGIHKSFGKVQALRGVDLSVERGAIVGLLGPNGAGKTTLVRILTTLLAPTRGEATVAGHDVEKDASRLRQVIGLAGQSAAVDEYLTGRENLVLVARLYHIPKAEAHTRADELLKRFDLVDAADRPTKTYSGGMRRRLDLASALIGDPTVLFLDEPTAGLDPRSRLALWSIIDGLRRDGKTILLTTQYLEEADRLADRIVVVDHGIVIAQGTPADLKAKVGGEVVEVLLADAASFVAATRVLKALHPQAEPARQRLVVAAKDGVDTLADVTKRLKAARVRPSEIALRRPTLDDVFLNLTGKMATQEEAKK